MVVNSGSDLPTVLNVGTGRGASVREVIDLISNKHGGLGAGAVEANRRPGDSVILCAQVRLIEKCLGFKTKFSLKESLES